MTIEKEQKCVAFLFSLQYSRFRLAQSKTNRPNLNKSVREHDASMEDVIDRVGALDMKLDHDPFTIICQSIATRYLWRYADTKDGLIL